MAQSMCSHRLQGSCSRVPLVEAVTYQAHTKLTLTYGIGLLEKLAVSLLDDKLLVRDADADEALNL